MSHNGSKIGDAPEYRVAVTSKRSLPTHARKIASLRAARCSFFFGASSGCPFLGWPSCGASSSLFWRVSARYSGFWSLYLSAVSGLTFADA